MKASQSSKKKSPHTNNIKKKRSPHNKSSSRNKSIKAGIIIAKSQHDNLMNEIIKKLSLPKNTSKKVSWMLSGRYVLYLYHEYILKDVIAQPYFKPSIINLIINDKLYKKICGKDNMNYMEVMLSDDNIVHVISDKTSMTKLANAERYENIYIANLNDILTEIQLSLSNMGGQLFDLFADIDYISKIILFKKAIIHTQIDIPNVVTKLQHEGSYLLDHEPHNFILNT